MGWGQKVRYVPRNPGNQTFLAGYPGILPGSARKVWEKNVWVHFLAPKRLCSECSSLCTGKNTILFKIITRIKLLFSNYLGRYSYSFRARQELISLQTQTFESNLPRTPPWRCKDQERKKEPKPKLLSPDIFSWDGGAFHVKGWGPKSSVCPSKPRESNLFWRDIPGFCRDIPEAPEKVWEKNVWVQFLAPKRLCSECSSLLYRENTILFKIITRIKLLISNYLGRYSYSFRARQELISVTVTVLWVWREYLSTATVRRSYIKKMVLRNYFPKITVTVT